ncbi:hypothetical protein CEE44_01790 [Candidatus Woesearchaeota archaeon B3_Woes]|nr:MAG: hypothetical protein CEE44_01790 [Candidatus Woesearchaeota archaeon B3_Woes]
MNFENFSLAAKSFIMNDNKLLIIKRSDDNVQKPGIWEVPGGRLGLEENHIEGLKREIKEETGLNIEVVRPLTLRKFTRDDNQRIELTNFLCKLSNPLDKNIKLSQEHTNSEWIGLDDVKNKITSFFYKEIDLIKNLEI